MSDSTVNEDGLLRSKTTKLHNEPFMLLSDDIVWAV